MADPTSNHADCTGRIRCAVLHVPVTRSNSRSTSMVEQGQITDRFTKAVDQLGAKDSIDVRLGGIYALERIARDSPRDHPTVMEVLSAFVREHAPATPCVIPLARLGPPTDVQAVLTVLGRRDGTWDRDQLNLIDSCLAEASLDGAHLARTNFFRTNLAFAVLIGADLAHANLIDANLSSALLVDAHMTNALLAGADLTGANLANADLAGADLSGANLTGAKLANTNLTGANLKGVNLTEIEGSPINTTWPAAVIHASMVIGVRMLI